MSQVAASLKTPLALSMESISERLIFHYHALMPKASSCIYLWHTGTTAHMLPLKQIENKKPKIVSLGEMKTVKSTVWKRLSHVDQRKFKRVA